jgi:hypothetical protein
MFVNVKLEAITTENPSIYKPLEKQENHENVRVSAFKVEIPLEDKTEFETENLSKQLPL